MRGETGKRVNQRTQGTAEVIKRVRVRSKSVESWCREQPKVGNP